MFNVAEHKAELEKICDLAGMYEKFRLVEPYTNRVYTLQGDRLVLCEGELCYQMWYRSSPCENCISLRACRDNKRYFKMEFAGGCSYIIAAIPVKVQGLALSLELAADMSDSLFQQDPSCKAEIEIKRLIARANRLSTIDIFTGLHNNSYMKNKMVSLIQNQDAMPLSLIILDIDKFKEVNDLHGHMAGDEVIQSIAYELTAVLTDIPSVIGHMGGDEFCIILERCDLSCAQNLGFQICDRIKGHFFCSRSIEFNVEVSMGVGEYILGESAYGFIDRVDMELYKTKLDKS
ncbi:MAG: GGDEF domain-containing protein [Oscillospiraceae bacterium]